MQHLLTYAGMVSSGLGWCGVSSTESYSNRKRSKLPEVRNVRERYNQFCMSTHNQHPLSFLTVGLVLCCTFFRSTLQRKITGICGYDTEEAHVWKWFQFYRAVQCLSFCLFLQNLICTKTISLKMYWPDCSVSHRIAVYVFGGGSGCHHFMINLSWSFNCNFWAHLWAFRYFYNCIWMTFSVKGWLYFICRTVN